MIRAAVNVLTATSVGVAAIVLFLYATNSTPVAPVISIADAAAAGQPYVVKFHARWCPICMTTKGIWSEIERSYAGRVRLLVFDFTNDQTTEASRAEAKRLGLEAFFGEYAGTTGSIVVLKRRTHEVTADIHGRRDIGEYRAAIDAALAAPPE
jgi:thiol-disulfide isomerase/thioredoxin